MAAFCLGEPLHNTMQRRLVNVINFTSSIQASVFPSDWETTSCFSSSADSDLTTTFANANNGVRMLHHILFFTQSTRTRTHTHTKLQQV